MRRMAGRCGSKVSTSAERAALLLFLLAACGEEERSPAAPPKQREGAAAPAPAPPPPPPPSEAVAAADERGAAELLKNYYALIGERRFAEAYRLREPGPGSASEAEFAAAFERYAEHRATVGAPSLTAEAGEWLYVEVPVQLYGRMKSGAPVASAGTMTLRRRKAEPNARWRIYTRG